MDSGTIVICAGGGGIPVCKGVDQKLTGIEAVIDKDASSGLLAEQIDADMFVMLTDVPGVCIDFGTKRSRVIANAGPNALAASSASFGSGSMGPKVTAACHFVSTTGQRAAIGALTDLNEIISGSRGTIVSAEGGVISFRDLG